jgi:hypothetical protein
MTWRSKRPESRPAARVRAFTLCTEAAGGLKWAFGGFARMLICAPGMQPGWPQARFRWIQRHHGAPRKRRGASLEQFYQCFCSPPAQKGLKIKAKSLRTHRARSLRRARSVKMGSRGLGLSGGPPEPPRQRRPRAPGWPGRPRPRPRSGLNYVRLL